MVAYSSGSAAECMLLLFFPKGHCSPVRGSVRLRPSLCASLWRLFPFLRLLRAKLRRWVVSQAVAFPPDLGLWLWSHELLIAKERNESSRSTQNRLFLTFVTLSSCVDQVEECGLLWRSFGVGYVGFFWGWCACGRSEG